MTSDNREAGVDLNYDLYKDDNHNLMISSIKGLLCVYITFDNTLRKRFYLHGVIFLI